MPNELIHREDMIKKLDQILQHELAGVVRYTHYSFMIFGYSRIPSSVVSKCSQRNPGSTPLKPGK